MEKGIKDLLIDELHDLLSCEQQIVEALPDMVAAAESSELKKAFATHLKETKTQIQRLTKIFKSLKVEKKKVFCKATKGLILEAKDVLKDFKKKSSLRDAALISKAQRIEHYEIAAYGSVRTFAKEASLYDVAALLQETLNEEENADKLLTKIAEGGLLTTGINHKANILAEAEIKKGISGSSRKKTASKAKKTSAAPAKTTFKTNSKASASTNKAKGRISAKSSTVKPQSKATTGSKSASSKGKSAGTTGKSTIAKKTTGTAKKATLSTKTNKNAVKSPTTHAKPVIAVKKRAASKALSARK